MFSNNRKTTRKSPSAARPWKVARSKPSATTATSESPAPARGGNRGDAIRERILSEWRGCDEVTDPNRGIHAAEHWVAAVLRAAGADEGLDEQQVRSTWKELAGEFIARHTEPVSVKKGHWVLRVTQPAMRFHLEQTKPMLLQRIREQLGESRIQSIKFTLG